ncbi:MAG TPA: hypothetical protein VG713_02390 [Pirellulales bacterium]|nr:hypothetical protein [Pirellulales bacterium]
MLNDENASYWRFTGPQRLDKAIHVLEGILKGISADGRITSGEVNLLTGWVHDHYEFAKRHPFNELIPVLIDALRDGQIDDEERDGLLWLCHRLSTEERFFDLVSSDMQRLHGIMAGISFDGEISSVELSELESWMEAHEHLRTCWPYDELESLITSVMADGKIDANEHRCLLAFMRDFSQMSGEPSSRLPTIDSPTVSGVCALCPEIRFVGSLFCFTGKSKRFTRSGLSDVVEQRGGRVVERVVADLDYLVIGGEGNPCWAYACYGRKVEQAVHLRKQGRHLLIVHEYDFWDSAHDSLPSCQ